MREKEAARNRCNSSRAIGRQTGSIVSNAELLRLAGWSALFVLVMLAIPTSMALMKCWGVW